MCQSEGRGGWSPGRRVVVFVCNPNQREAGPSLNWEKAQRLKKAMKTEPVLEKESVCFANQQYLVIGESPGGLEPGRFELVLKGLEEKNVKFMNIEYKKIVQMGSLMRFLVFPSLVKRKCQGKDCNISVLLYLQSNFPMNIDSLSLYPSSFLATEEDSGIRDMEHMGGSKHGWMEVYGAGWGLGRQEVNQLGSEGSGVSSAMYLRLSINHMCGNGKGLGQSIRKPVFQSWLGF